MERQADKTCISTKKQVLKARVFAVALLFYAAEMDTEERGRKKTACVAIDAYHLCERWQDHRTNADIRE